MQQNLNPGRKIMGRLAQGEDLLAALGAVCRTHGISLGEVQAIGAVSKARVGYYHQGAQKYQFLELNRPLEILALIGNVSLKDGQPFVHAHVTLGDEDGHAFGGHLAEGTVVFAGEFVLQEYGSPQPFTRQLDEATGPFLWAEPRA
jgi:predicted DNA-binding protein with PD1-like motif